jgi:cell division protein FtsQ
VRVLARRFAPQAGAAAVALVLGIGGWFGWHYLTASPRFAVREIRFGALHHVEADELRERLPVAVGQNIFRADLRAAARELQQHPWVASASLRRELPGTIVVDVEERVAAAVVELDTLYLADPSGTVFKRATLEEADGLLVVSGLTRDQYVEDPAATQALVREAIGVADAWTAHEQRPAVSEAAVDVLHGVTLFLRQGGIEIRLGRGELARKLAQYDLLARDLERHHERPRAIILDSTTRPNRAAVRLQPAAEGG